MGTKVKKNMSNRMLATAASLLLALVGAAFMSTSAFAQSETLQEVKRKGAVNCGLNKGLKGFSHANSLGDYSGLDSDFCRAVASAIFNDPTAVIFSPLTASERFPALTSGRIDLLARNTTWTMSRNIEFGEFVGINYYDGQGFLVSKSSGIRSALELDNKGICVIQNTTTELNAEDFFSASKMRYRPIYFDTSAEINQAYIDGRCDAITTDRSGLAATRASLERPDAHVVLPEVISKEPLGPVVRHGDSTWTNIVRWTLNCMVNAEEMGITSSNIAQVSRNASPAMARLLGKEGNFGELLGIDNDWCANIVTHIGNYSESYERNVGENTALGLTRGVNRLWTDGGLMYAPPIR